MDQNELNMWMDRAEKAERERDSYVEALGAAKSRASESVGRAEKAEREAADLQARLNGAEQRASVYEREWREARAEIDRLKGLKPELPPYPPEGSGLPRYGLRWEGDPKRPLAVPMADGYWTPAHLAAAERAQLEAQLAEAKADRAELTQAIAQRDAADDRLAADVVVLREALTKTVRQWERQLCSFLDHEATLVKEGAHKADRATSARGGYEMLFWVSHELARGVRFMGTNTRAALAAPSNADAVLSARDAKLRATWEVEATVAYERLESEPSCDRCGGNLSADASCDMCRDLPPREAKTPGKGGG